MKPPAPARGVKATKIAKSVREMGHLRNLEGGVHGHAIGYYRAADAIAELGNREIRSAEQLRGLKFVGPKTLDVVAEILRTGGVAAVRENAALLKSHHRSTSPASQARRRSAEATKRATSPAARRAIRSPARNSLFAEGWLNHLA